MQSSSQIITNKRTSSYLQARCPSCRPTNSVKALKGKTSHSMDLLTPSSPGGLPTLSLTTNSSWLPWGRVAMPLISPLMPVPKLSEICGLQTKILVNPRHIHKPTQLHISSMERNINTRSLQSRSNHLHMLEVKEILDRVQPEEDWVELC